MPVIVPTKRCNLRCRHCMRSTFASEFLDPGLHEKFINDVLINYGPQADNWAFTGGEPTLHPELGQLIDSYGKYRLKVSIMTNGQYDPGVELAIKHKQHLSFIRLSIDGPNPEINDPIRGEGSFNQALRACHNYIRNGVRVGLGVTAHEDNIDEIEQCIKLGQYLGVSSVAIWGTQQWVDVASSDTRTKSLKKGEDIEWDQNTDKKIAQAKLDLIKKYKDKFKFGLFISEKFNQSVLNDKWVCQNYSNDASRPVNPANRIVLLPDGLVSACCDLYDVNYNVEKYDPSPFCEKPVSDILGNFNNQSITDIIDFKKQQFAHLAERRKRDLDAGLLINGRENDCTNCAYYHYQPASNSKKIIPIVAS